MQDASPYKSFVKQLASYRARLEAYAFSIVREHEAARDIVGDVIAAVLKKTDTIDDKGLLSYLYTAVRNSSLNYRRDSKRHGKKYMIEDYLESSYIQTITSVDISEILKNDIALRVRKSLEKMPVDICLVWRKSRVEGKSYKEIADEMHIPVKRVDKYLQKVNKTLRKELADYL